MKRLILLSLCFAGAAAAAATAEVRAQYRIVTTDGRVIVARDLPKQDGSVTTFHADRTGALTGLPTEQIVRVETSVTPQRFVPRTGPSGAAVSGGAEAVTRPLQPGEVLVLGPIGDGGGGSIANQAAAAGAIPGNGSATGAGANGGGNFVNSNGTFSNGTSNGTLGFDPRMLGGGTAPSTGLLPNGQPATQPLAGDVLRAQSGEVPTMSIDTQTQTSPNGFPANAASQTTTLNPNGQPNTTVTGPVAGSTQPIGPNGFPGTPQNVTGPNGFPVTGGASTTPQNLTGPNGFAGPAGSTPQNVTNPNGFPAVGAPGTGTSGTTSGTTATGAGQVIVAPNGTITNTRGAASAPGTSAVPQQQQRGTQQKSGTTNAPGGAAAPSGGAAPSSSSGPSH
jgi:hypothetical protein